MSRQNKKPTITSDNVRSYCAVVANELGVNTAIVFHYISYWVEHNYINRIPSAYREGVYWMFKTREDIGTWLGMNETSVRYAIKILLDKGIIIRNNKLNRDARIRTYWYSLTTGILKIKSNTYTNLQFVQALKKQEDINANENLLSHKSSLPTEKNEGCINIEDNDIEEVKDYSINTIVTANAVPKTNDIEYFSKPKEKETIPIEKQKELHPIENKEENIPTKEEESKKQFSKTQPKTDLELSADFLPNQWEKENKKYPRVIDMETKKPEPRFSQGDYDKTVGFVNTWAKHGGTKHKITEYDDASNKTFMFILETMKFHSSNILEYFKKGNWNKKWLSNLKLTEESLKRAIETRGGDEEAFRYACGKHFQYIQQGLTKVDFRILPKGFDKFLKTTQKDGSEISWLLHHIVSQGTAHVAKDDYFWNTHEIPEDVKRQVMGFTKDIQDWFKGAKSEKSIINWANYIYATNCKVWELKPSTRYSNQSKDLITLFGALKDIIHHGDMRTNKEPSWFTLGLAFESQKTLLEKLQIRALRDFVEKFTEISNSEQKKQLPWYKKD